MRSDVSLRAVNLRCEYRDCPLGIDAPSPRLGWQLQSERRDVLQTGWQVQVSVSANAWDDRALVWDSGKNHGDAIRAVYDGAALESRTRYFFRVKAWDNHGDESPWSEACWWETGLLHPTDWQATLISPADDRHKTQEERPAWLLRNEFHVEKPVQRARLYITSLGLYEAHVNGLRAGDEYFTPGWTTYNKCLQYQTHDVTSHLRQGSNAIGVMLGDGWYRGHVSYINFRNVYGDELALLAQLEVQYEDGSVETLGSDGSWRCATGEVTANDLFHGETVDARLQQRGWSTAGFDASTWQAVRERSFDTAILAASTSQPVRKIEDIRPLRIFTTPAGQLVADFGQNISGFVRLQAKAERGATVRLKFGEVLDRDGNFYTKNLRMARATDAFVFAGTGDVEVFEPRFTFHGFRYVSVEGLPGVSEDMLTAVVLHSDLPQTGGFSCSDARVNQLFRNIMWSQRDNFLDVPTDCPQRDERMGWTGDIQVFAPTACLNMDAAAFLQRWLRDVRVDQRSNGLIPMVVPDAFADGAKTFAQVVRNAVFRRKGDEKGPFDEYFAVFQLSGSVGWGDAGIVVPWVLYQFYGDKSILETQYESMQAMFAFRRKKAGALHNIFRFPLRAFHTDTWKHLRHFTSDWYGFGDWLAPADGMDGSILRSRRYIPTAYLAYTAKLMANTAEVLGRPEDATAYRELFENVRAAFQYFFMNDDGSLRIERQTAYVMALAFDLLPEGKRGAAAQRLAAMVSADDYRIGTGFLGTPHICHVLSEHGYAEHAYKLLLNDNHQWLYQVKHGATTVWEHWNNIREDGSFTSERMLSFNHFAPGAVAAWLYQVVAGIRPVESAAGFSQVMIAPVPGGGLTHASAHYDSAQGRIAASWRIDDNGLQLDVEIPANCRASVRIPEVWRGRIRYAETVLTSTDQMVFGSGKHRFHCSASPSTDRFTLATGAMVG